MNKINKEDFINRWRGGSSSLGGYYNECVTFFKEFLREAGKPNPGDPIGGTGGALEIWRRRHVLGYDAYFDYVQVMQRGDWCIWGPSMGGGLGHVAMFLKDNGNGTGQFLGMNQGDYHSPVNEKTLSYSGSLGALRYKGFTNASSSNTTNSSQSVLNGIPSDFHYENATFFPYVTIKIRKAPSLSGEDTGLVYKKGMSVRYEGYVVREGYVWITWISASTGERRWMACGETNSKGQNVAPYGTFR